jgi:hypothetical protein
MSTEVKPNNEERAAIERIDAELYRFRSMREATAEPLSEADLGEICKIYHAIKGPLEILVAFLKKLPGGATAAGVIEFLMKIADALCPA